MFNRQEIIRVEFHKDRENGAHDTEMQTARQMRNMLRSIKCSHRDKGFKSGHLDFFPLTSFPPYVPCPSSRQLPWEKLADETGQWALDMKKYFYRIVRGQHSQNWKKSRWIDKAQCSCYRLSHSLRKSIKLLPKKTIVSAVKKKGRTLQRSYGNGAVLTLWSQFWALIEFIATN